MLKQIQLYALIGLLALSVLTGGASLYLWKANQELNQTLKQKEASIKKAQDNLKLVSEQLATERETRLAAEEALSDLKDVPDVDYSTPLPPSISNVLTGFRDRMQ